MFCYQNRLLIVGPVQALKAFDRQEDWMKDAGAKHLDPLEMSPGRYAWQFETTAPPLDFLRQTSRQWPSLTFLLDYDSEDQHRKGLVKARKGRLRHCWVRY